MTTSMNEPTTGTNAPASPLSSQRPEEIRGWLLEKLAEVLKTDPAAIDTAAPLTRFGLDSMDAITLSGDLEDWLELRLPSTLLWDYPTIDGIVTYLTEVPSPESQAAGSSAEDLGMPVLAMDGAPDSAADTVSRMVRDGNPA
jgi:acyl carrier protein